EKRAAALVDEQEIVRQSKNKAAEITQQAQQQSREMRQSAKDFVDGILKNTEETLAASLTEVRGTRNAFNQQQKAVQAAMQPQQK
ncbi:MAG: ATPase, partial [Oscillospiraceae bacterium]|nr:ATPase [Oscillospiraceae bacterium]